MTLGVVAGRARGSLARAGGSFASPLFSLRFALLTVLWLLLAATSPALRAAEAGRGYVEQATLLSGQRQLLLAGWAAPERPNVFVTNLIVRIGGKTVYRGRMQRYDRPDVADHTGRADWLWSGWRAQIALPAGTPAGAQPLEVRMRLGDGAEFTLALPPALATVDVPAAPIPPARALALALLALGAPLAVLLAGGPIGRCALSRGRPWLAPGMFGGMTLLSFALLVAAGLTGSSIELALGQSAVTQSNARHWAGSLRPIRSDEWEVITPLAIAQLHHDPSLPKVNHNLGSDGANMMVIGMTGVPVADVSSLAKPATWGFFALDLKRALAWYWWFPFFGCFAALWVLLGRLFALDWRIAAALAATLAAAPYSVVFSGWPAYVAFFPVLALVLADVALRTRRVAVGLICGATLGVALAGYALVLYPAWQISLAWLLAPLGLAWFWRDRRSLHFGAAQWIALALALAVGALLLGSWWAGAHDAVRAIRGTVYPGQRSAEVGGDIDPWFLVKGLLSPVTMYSESGAMDPSDAGSFVFVLLPVAAAVLLAWLRRRRIDGVAAALVGFVLLALAFMFIGFDARWARLTLWGSTTSYRMDLALGLAQVLLLGWLLAPARGLAPASRWNFCLAGAIALVAALHAAWLLRLVPPQIAASATPAFLLMSCVALAVCGWLLMAQRRAAFALLFCAWMLATALPFNPIGQAPSSVALAPELAGAGLDVPGPDGRRGVAVIDERIWSMTLPAAGLPVINSVFYHPQQSLWRALDPGGQQRVLYNRYQRLLFTLRSLAGEAAYRIESPRLDEVRVTFDPARFDFRLLGARFVLAPPRDRAALAANATLSRVDLPESKAGEFVLFRVVGGVPDD